MTSRTGTGGRGGSGKGERVVGAVVPPHVTNSLLHYCVAVGAGAGSGVGAGAGRGWRGAARENGRDRSGRGCGNGGGNGRERGSKVCEERRVAMGMMLLRLVPGAWTGSRSSSSSSSSSSGVPPSGFRSSVELGKRTEGGKEERGVNGVEGGEVGEVDVEGAGSEFGMLVVLLGFLERLGRCHAQAQAYPATYTNTNMSAGMRVRTMSSSSVVSLGGGGMGSRSMSTGMLGGQMGGGASVGVGGGMRTRTNSYGGGMGPPPPPTPPLPRFGFGNGFNPIPGRALLQPHSRSPSSASFSFSNGQSAAGVGVGGGMSMGVVDMLINMWAQKVMGGTREEAGVVMRWLLERWERMVGLGLLEEEEGWEGLGLGLGVARSSVLGEGEGEEDGIITVRESGEGGIRLRSGSEGVGLVGVAAVVGGVDTLGRRRGKKEGERERGRGKIPFGRGIEEEWVGEDGEFEGEGELEEGEEDDDECDEEETIHGHDRDEEVQVKMKGTVPQVKAEAAESKEMGVSKLASPSSSKGGINLAGEEDTEDTPLTMLPTLEKTSFEKMVDSAITGSSLLPGLSLPDNKLRLSIPEDKVKLSIPQDKVTLSIPEDKVFIADDKVRLPERYKLPSASASSLSVFSIFTPGGGKDRDRERERDRDREERGERETVGIGKRLLRRMSSMSLRRR